MEFSKLLQGLSQWFGKKSPSRLEQMLDSFTEDESHRFNDVFRRSESAREHLRSGMQLLYTNNRNYDVAIMVFNKIIELAPHDNPIAYFCRGDAYQGKGDYDAAIRDYDKVIELLPNNPIAYLGRGDAYQGKEDYTAAIVNYNKVIVLNSRNAEAYYNRGNAYCGCGVKYRVTKNYLDAFRDFKKAAELDSRYRARLVEFERLVNNANRFGFF